MARSDPNAVPARNLQGVFLDTATSPASQLRVLVEDFSDRDGFGPVVWNPLRDGSGWVYPTAGDRAWISEVRSELRSEWVVVFWQPAAALAPDTDVHKAPLPFGANWANYGTTWEDASYSRYGQVVRLQGLVTKSGTPTAGDVIATLPTGFRPSEDLAFLVLTGTTTEVAGRVDVHASGTVTWQRGSTVEQDYTSLSGVSFVV